MDIVDHSLWLVLDLMIRYKGLKVSEWASRLSIDCPTLYARMSQHGITIGKAVEYYQKNGVRGYKKIDHHTTTSSPSKYEGGDDMSNNRIKCPLNDKIIHIKLPKVYRIASQGLADYLGLERKDMIGDWVIKCLTKELRDVLIEHDGKWPKAFREDICERVVTGDDE